MRLKTTFIIALLLTGCTNLSVKSNKRAEVEKFLQKLNIKQADKQTFNHLANALDRPENLLDNPGPGFITGQGKNAHIYRHFFFTRFDFENPSKIKILSNKLRAYIKSNNLPTSLNMGEVDLPIPPLKNTKLDLVKAAFASPLLKIRPINRRVSSEDSFLHKYPGAKNYTESTKKFMIEAINEVHAKLRLAVAVSGYHVVCLTGDTSWWDDQVKGKKQGVVKILGQWFGKDRSFIKRIGKWFSNVTGDKANVGQQDKWLVTRLQGFFYRPENCHFKEGILTKLKEDIEEKFPIMRQWLVLYNYRYIGNYNNALFQHDDESDEEWEVRRKNAFNYFQNNRHLMKHPLARMADLARMSEDEVIAAQRALYSDDFPCGKNDLECFDKEYKKIIFGDFDRLIPGLPVLGLVSSATPSDQELAEALSRIRDRTSKLLAKFRKQYMVKNDEGEYLIKDEELDVSGSRAKMRPKDFSISANADLFKFKGIMSEVKIKYPELVEEGFAAYEKIEKDRMWIELGVVISWSVACYAVLKYPVARGMCQLPINIGTNIFSFVASSKHFNEAIDIAFYRHDGYSVFHKYSKFNDLNFARNLTLILLPFFTGIKDITKHLK